MKMSIITEEAAIRNTVPLLQNFVRQAGTSLPFSCIQMPFEWWRQFNSRENSLFGDKRGKNFMGNQCRLEKFSIFLVEEDNRICGFAPLYSYRVNCSGHTDDLRVLAFASDYVLAPYQDVFILPGKRKAVLSCLLKGLYSQLAAQEYDLVFLGYIPENSPNIPVLRKLLSVDRDSGIESMEAVTSQRGGVWPWTIDGITGSLRQILDKRVEDIAVQHKVQQLVDKLESCTPMSLFFPETRLAWFAEVKAVLGECSEEKKFSADIEKVSSFLRTRFLPYPYIELPASREEYLARLSRSTRRYFRRYTKKWQQAGGTFERLDGTDIQAGDIDDYIRLHHMRWRDESAAMSGTAELFHREICRSMRREGVLSLFFATFQGKRIAAQSCFDMHKRREAYLTGRDPEYQELRAGRLLYLETIYDAVDQGVTRYDMGALDFSYKKSFATGMSSSRSFFLFNAGGTPDLDRLFTKFECMVPV